MTKKIPRPEGRKSFETPVGHAFLIGEGEREETSGSERWDIFFEEGRAGTIFRNLNYGLGKTGEPRWSGSTRRIYWRLAADAPIGIGFDVSAFDTLDEVLEAWGHSVDEIIAWSRGERVENIRDKRGYSQKGQDQ